jgi:hypothetical protein
VRYWCQAVTVACLIGHFLVGRAASAQGESSVPRLVQPPPLLLPVDLVCAEGSLACVPDRTYAVGPELFPKRNDHAWEGLAFGVCVGLLLGLAINSAFADLEGERSFGAVLGTLAWPIAVTAPLGLFVGSAIPKHPPDSGGDAADSVSSRGGPNRQRSSARRSARLQ